MKLSTLVLGLLFSAHSFANLHQAPPDLNLGQSLGVFVDFKKAKSVITYDISKRSVAAVTTIEFSQNKAGKPIFDLVNSPTSIRLNGESIESQTTSMNGVSTVRYLDKSLEAGSHSMIIENSFSTNLSWGMGTVKSAFWMSDLSDRRYIEQYLPTNLEFDQYQSDFEIKIIGSTTEHTLYTNGAVSEVASNHWNVRYPETYTASSYFLHITPKGAIPEQKASYRSIDGREIPVTVYTSQSTSRFMNATLGILAELEADYGPWPHAQVIIYGAGSGGMEHCGATITSFSALGHELIHSYFARGVMPAHGNSGWVDEAIASWRDSNYQTYSSRSLSRTNMAAHSVYQRTTDRDAYSKGMRFMGYLNGKFEGQESFKVFLKNFFDEYKFKPFKTAQFQKAIEDFYNTDMSNEFDTYIYGKMGVDNKSGEQAAQNPYHPKLSEQQLLDLL